MFRLVFLVDAMISLSPFTSPRLVWFGLFRFFSFGPFFLGAPSSEDDLEDEEEEEEENEPPISASTLLLVLPHVPPTERVVFL